MSVAHVELAGDFAARPVPASLTRRFRVLLGWAGLFSLALVTWLVAALLVTWQDTAFDAQQRDLAVVDQIAPMPLD